MKKKILAGVLSALLITTTSISVMAEGLDNFDFSAEAQSFTDVPSTSWYYSSVSQTSASGIINGIGNGQFNPDGTLTHAEAMTLMAKVHAIYQYGNANIINDYAPTSDHWASGIYAYCQAHSLPTPNESNFDTNITRGTMARYFRQSLPSAAFEEINDISLAPEDTTNSMVQDLFCAGIMIGDDSGFRLKDSITRAEATAIIHRVANPDVRVKVEAKAPETQTPQQPATPVQPQQPTTPQQPATPVQPQQPTTPQQPVMPVQPGQVQTDKPYKNIPHTNWQSDPTGGVTITSQSGYINTIYGNHSYGCSNQEEYDKVMSVIGEAYNYASQKETTRVYRGGDIMKYYVKPGGQRVKFFNNELGIYDDNQIMSMGITEDFVKNMADYLYTTYAKPNGNGSNTDAQNNNVYKYLFNGGDLDCDGNAHLYMLCYDYLGFSTRTITSLNITHACAQVYVNGEWVFINNHSGKLFRVTHSQLKELMQGIKNDAYEDNVSAECDPIVLNASIHPEKLSDLHIRSNENPTHNPSDYSVK